MTNRNIYLITEHKICTWDAWKKLPFTEMNANVSKLLMAFQDGVFFGLNQHESGKKLHFLTWPAGAT